jgi:hypothetical protein
MIVACGHSAKKLWLGAAAIPGSAGKSGSAVVFDASGGAGGLANRTRWGRIRSTVACRCKTGPQKDAVEKTVLASRGSANSEMSSSS